MDETGQDPGSSIFVVVVVVGAGNQDRLRQALISIENAAGTGRGKWHKSQPERRLRYLSLVLGRNLAGVDVYFGVYPKPIPFFFPMLEVLDPGL